MASLCTIGRTRCVWCPSSRSSFTMQCFKTYWHSAGTILRNQRSGIFLAVELAYNLVSTNAEGFTTSQICFNAKRKLESFSCFPRNNWFHSRCFTRRDTAKRGSLTTGIQSRVRALNRFCVRHEPSEIFESGNLSRQNGNDGP